MSNVSQDEYEDISREGLIDMLEEAGERLEQQHALEKSLRVWQKREGVELLTLIADLNKSEDKSRQALGAELKRLTAGVLISTPEEV